MRQIEREGEGDGKVTCLSDISDSHWDEILNKTFPKQAAKFDRRQCFNDVSSPSSGHQSLCHNTLAFLRVTKKCSKVVMNSVNFRFIYVYNDNTSIFMRKSEGEKEGGRDIYIYISFFFLNIYIYIQRERESVKDRERERDSNKI